VLIVYYIQTDRHLDVERLSIDLIPSGITYDFDKYLDGDNKLGAYRYNNGQNDMGGACSTYGGTWKMST
jgi:hypothetical protein